MFVCAEVIAKVIMAAPGIRFFPLALELREKGINENGQLLRKCGQ